MRLPFEPALAVALLEGSAAVAVLEGLDARARDRVRARLAALAASGPRELDATVLVGTGRHAPQGCRQR